MSLEAREKFAEFIADYVETNIRYESLTKREVVVATVFVLLNDIGAAQKYLDTIGLKIDLYEYDFKAETT